MASRKEYRIKLISKEFLNSDTCYLGFECPEIAKNSQPGQFVNISAGTVFLKRPFGIASVDKEKGTFNIGVKVVGKGTKEISEFETGMMVDCLGPLGNGFDLATAGPAPLLVGGGIGTAPLFWLARTLRAQGTDVFVVMGFRAETEVFYEADFRALGCRVTVVTENGGYGTRGLVTDALPEGRSAL